MSLHLLCSFFLESLSLRYRISNGFSGVLILCMCLFSSAFWRILLTLPPHTCVKIFISANIIWIFQNPSLSLFLVITLFSWLYNLLILYLNIIGHWIILYIPNFPPLGLIPCALVSLISAWLTFLMKLYSLDQTWSCVQSLEVACVGWTSMGRQWIHSLGLFSFSREDSFGLLLDFDMGLRLEEVSVTPLLVCWQLGRADSRCSSLDFLSRVAPAPHAESKHVVPCPGVRGCVPLVDMPGVSRPHVEDISVLDCHLMCSLAFWVFLGFCARNQHPLPAWSPPSCIWALSNHSRFPCLLPEFSCLSLCPFSLCSCKLWIKRCSLLSA